VEDDKEVASDWKFFCVQNLKLQQKERLFLFKKNNIFSFLNSDKTTFEVKGIISLIKCYSNKGSLISYSQDEITTTIYSSSTDPFHRSFGRS